MSKENEKGKSVLGGAAAAVLASKAPKNLLGYEKVHHGTSTSAAESIKKTGLRKSYSGSGVAAADVALGRATHNQVKGKVYTSTMASVAEAHQPGFAGMKMGNNLTARVPYREKKRLAVDHVFKNMVDGKDTHTKYNKLQRTLAKPQLKSLRIYKHSIPSRFIEGGHDYAGRKQFATKGNLRRYLSTTGGKLRFAKGVAQAAGSGASALYAIAHGIKARRKELQKSAATVEELKARRNKGLGQVAGSGIVMAALPVMLGTQVAGYEVGKKNRFKKEGRKVILKHAKGSAKMIGKYTAPVLAGSALFHEARYRLAKRKAS